MCKVSRHLQPLYLKCGICQLTDHEYDMSMPTFCNYLVTVPLMLCTVCFAMAGVLAFYYRSLRIVLTLLRRSNISGRPCMRVITYNTLAFLYIKMIR